MIRRPPRSTPLYSSAASDVYKRQVLCHPIQTCSLAYIAGCHRRGTRLIPIYKQHGERGNVVVRQRERERTADDRVIKAELHPPHRAGRQATVRPSRLLLMTWVSKNLQLLSHPVRSRVTATMLVTRLKRRRCNRFLRQQSHTLHRRTCLLYTSDAADE